MIGGTANSRSLKRAENRVVFENSPNQPPNFTERGTHGNCFGEPRDSNGRELLGESWPSIQKPPPTKCPPLSTAGSEGGTPSANRGPVPPFFASPSADLGRQHQQAWGLGASCPLRRWMIT
ncbi:hypothetical protein MRB53_034383 [Persea americana]|uniref:Uncharacterized protein n=1 Tax=Persea americana TaxID=3435 RepID=A0ACC2KXY5_PERAE|nr:hypothetical protein MRB53_034383 [Persea americana]